MAQNPFSLRGSSPYYTTAEDLAGMQYRFELNRLIKEHQTGELDKEDLKDQVTDLVTSAGITDPKMVESFLQHPAFTTKFAQQQYNGYTVPPEEDDGFIQTVVDAGKDIFGNIIPNIYDLGKRDLGKAMEAAGTIDEALYAQGLKDGVDPADPTFFENMVSTIAPEGLRETGKRWKEEAQAGLEEDDYQIRTELGEGLQSVPGMVGQGLMALLVGGTGAATGYAAGLATPAPGGAAIGAIGGGIAGSIAGSDFVTALQVAGETIDSWRSHPLWAQMRTKLGADANVKDLENQIQTEIVREVYNDRMASMATVVDGLSTAAYAIPGLGALTSGARVATHIGIDAVSEGASEIADTAFQGSAINRVLRKFAREQGFNEVANNDRYKIDAWDWIADKENHPEMWKAGRIGAMTGAAVSIPGSIAQEKIAQRRLAEANQKKLAEKAKKELESWTPEQEIEAEAKAQREQIRFINDEERKEELHQQKLANQQQPQQPQSPEPSAAAKASVVSEAAKVTPDNLAEADEQLTEVQKLKAQKDFFKNPKVGARVARKQKGKRSKEGVVDKVVTFLHRGKPVTGLNIQYDDGTYEENVFVNNVSLTFEARTPETQPEAQPQAQTSTANIITDPQEPADSQVEIQVDPNVEVMTAEDLPGPQTKEETVESLGADDGSWTQINRDLYDNPPDNLEYSPTPLSLIADYQRTLAEQQKRERLLSNENELIAYAKNNGISVSEQKDLLLTNYKNNQPRLAELEAKVKSPEFQEQQAEAKRKASTIKFQEEIGRLKVESKTKKEEAQKRNKALYEAKQKERERERASETITTQPPAEPEVVTEPEVQPTVVTEPQATAEPVVLKRGDRVSFVNNKGERTKQGTFQGYGTKRDGGRNAIVKWDNSTAKRPQKNIQLGSLEKVGSEGAAIAAPLAPNQSAPPPPPAPPPPIDTDTVPKSETPEPIATTEIKTQEQLKAEYEARRQADTIPPVAPLAQEPVPDNVNTQPRTAQDIGDAEVDAYIKALDAEQPVADPKPTAASFKVGDQIVHISGLVGTVKKIFQDGRREKVTIKFNGVQKQKQYRLKDIFPATENNLRWGAEKQKNASYITGGKLPELSETVSKAGRRLQTQSLYDQLKRKLQEAGKLTTVYDEDFVNKVQALGAEKDLKITKEDIKELEDKRTEVKRQLDEFNRTQVDREAYAKEEFERRAQQAKDAEGQRRIGGELFVPNFSSNFTNGDWVMRTDGTQELKKLKDKGAIAFNEEGKLSFFFDDGTSAVRGFGDWVPMTLNLTSKEYEIRFEGDEEGFNVREGESYTEWRERAESLLYAERARAAETAFQRTDRLVEEAAKELAEVDPDPDAKAAEDLEKNLEALIANIENLKETDKKLEELLVKVSGDKKLSQQLDKELKATNKDIEEAERAAAELKKQKELLDAEAKKPKTKRAKKKAWTELSDVDSGTDAFTGNLEEIAQREGVSKEELASLEEAYQGDPRTEGEFYASEAVQKDMEKPITAGQLHFVVDWLIKNVFTGLDKSKVFIFKNGDEISEFLLNAGAERGTTPEADELIKASRRDYNTMNGAIVNSGSQEAIVVLNASGITGKNLLDRVRTGLEIFAHESIGHGEFMRLFNSRQDFHDFANRLYADRETEIDKWYAERYGADRLTDNPIVKSAEWLAQNFAEKGTLAYTFVDFAHNLLNTKRKWGSPFGIKDDSPMGREVKKLTDGEIIRLYSMIDSKLRKGSRLGNGWTLAPPPVLDTEAGEGVEPTQEQNDLLNDMLEEESNKVNTEDVTSDSTQINVADPQRKPATTLENVLNNPGGMASVLASEDHSEKSVRLAMQHLKIPISEQADVFASYMQMSSDSVANRTSDKGVPGLIFNDIEELDNYYDQYRTPEENTRGLSLQQIGEDAPSPSDQVILRELSYKSQMLDVPLARLQQLLDLDDVMLRSMMRSSEKAGDQITFDQVTRKAMRNSLARDFLKRNRGQVTDTMDVPATILASTERPRAEQFLALRSPLAEQSPYIQGQLSAQFNSELTGQQIFDQIKRSTGGESSAAMTLLTKFGVRGAQDENGITLFNDHDPDVLNQIYASELRQDEPITMESNRSFYQKLQRAWGNFWNPLHGLGEEQDALRKILNRFSGLRGEIEEDFSKLSSSFADATETEIPIIYKAFTEKDPAKREVSLQQLSEERRAKVLEAREQIHKTGLALVMQGLMSPESFTKYDGGYLPRKYMMYLLNDADRKAIGAGRAVSSMGYLAQRLDTDIAFREFWKGGEIKAPDYLTAMALIQPNRDMAILEMLKLLRVSSMTPERRRQLSLRDNPFTQAGLDAEKQLGTKINMSGYVLDDSQHYHFVHPNSTMSVNYFQMFNQVLDQMMDDPKYAGRRIKDEDVVGGPIMPSDNVEVTPLFLIQQADEIVELAAQGQFNDLQVDFRNRVARLMREEASNSQDFLDQTLINQEDWKEIPGRDSKDSKRYGALAGLLVRKEIYDQIFGTESFQTVGGDSDTAIKWRERNQTVVDFWKWGKVPANIPSWGRNIYSNSGMMHLAGMPIWAQAKALPAAWREFKNNGPRLLELKKHGLVASTFSANELKQIETAVKERLANRADLSVKQGMWDSLTGNTKVMSRKGYRWLRDKTGRVYQGIEVVDKLMLATYLQDTKGMSPEDSMVETNRWLFDYSEVSPLVRFARKNIIGTPFITWLYKATPRFAEIAASPFISKEKGVKKLEMWKNAAPFVAVHYLATSTGLDAVSSLWDDDAEDWDSKDQEHYESILPEYMQRKKRYMLDLWKLTGGDEDTYAVVADLLYSIPYGSHHQAISDLFNGDVTNALKEFGFLGSPVITSAFGLTGRDIFRNRDIVEEEDASAATKIEKYAKFYWDTWMPAMLGTTGAITRIGEALLADTDQGELWQSGAFDRYGDPRFDTAQALLYLAGINTSRINVDKSLAMKVKRLEKKMDMATYQYQNELVRIEKVYKKNPEGKAKKTESAKANWMRKMNLYMDEQRKLNFGTQAKLKKRLADEGMLTKMVQ